MATNMLNLTKVENQTILTDVTRYNLSEQIRSAGDRSRRCKKRLWSCIMEKSLSEAKTKRQRLPFLYDIDQQGDVFSILHPEEPHSFLPRFVL